MPRVMGSWRGSQRLFRVPRRAVKASESRCWFRTMELFERLVNDPKPFPDSATHEQLSINTHYKHTV